MSTFNKTGSLNQIRIFALCQLSSYLYGKNQQMTLKSLAEFAKVSPSTLSGIKNGSIKSISLNKLMEIMDNLDLDYSLMVQRSGGITQYHFGMDRRQVWVGSSREHDYQAMMDNVKKDRKETKTPNVQMLGRLSKIHGELSHVKH